MIKVDVKIKDNKYLMIKGVPRGESKLATLDVVVSRAPSSADIYAPPCLSF
jgi:hypothetical protein